MPGNVTVEGVAHRHGGTDLEKLQGQCRRNIEEEPVVGGPKATGRVRARDGGCGTGAEATGTNGDGGEGFGSRNTDGVSWSFPGRAHKDGRARERR